MRLLKIGTLLTVAALFGGAALAGCSDSGGPAVNYQPSGGTGQTAAGTSSTSGTGTTAGTGTGGSGTTAGTGTGGSQPTAGTPAGGTGGSATAGTGGMSGGGDAGGTGGGGGNDLFKPKPSAGCGKMPADAAVTGGKLRAGNWAELTNPNEERPGLSIDTQTPKGARARKYNIWLPANYDPNKPYRVFYQGPGCGGKATDVYGLQNVSGFDGIRVGLTFFPGEHEGTCFDDKEGDDSIEWPYFKAVHAIVKANVCVDEHRVFATGTSSGSWLSNELACVSGSNLIGEAGEPVIRGTATTTGGLPTGQEVPTCTTTKYAGIWIHDLNDIASNPYAGSQRAVERAIQVNGCVVAGQPTKFEVNNETYWEAYPITGAARQICKKAKGCPAEYPLVMCSSTGQGHGDQGDLAPLAYIQFLQSLNP